jgi:hypothetical protein
MNSKKENMHKLFRKENKVEIKISPKQKKKMIDWANSTSVHTPIIS